MANSETLAHILAEIRSDEAAKVMATGLLWQDMSFQFNSWADRIEAAVEQERNRQCKPKCNWSIMDALALANTLANHGLRDGNADAASSCIYSLCRILSSPGNASAMREALENSNGLLEELAMIGEWGESAREQIAENNASLAAPPRNCDLCKDWLALYVNFRPPKGMREMPPEWVDAVAAFCKWLKAEGKEASNG